METIDKYVIREMLLPVCFGVTLFTFIYFNRYIDSNDGEHNSQQGICVGSSSDAFVLPSTHTVPDTSNGFFSWG